MGKRVNYEIGTLPSVILFSNSSHDTEAPDQLFRAAVERHGPGQTALTRDLLNMTYQSDSANGRHRAGDPVFGIDLEPGDRELVLQVDFNGERPVIRELGPGPRATRRP